MLRKRAYEGDAFEHVMRAKYSALPGGVDFFGYRMSIMEDGSSTTSTREKMAIVGIRVETVH